MAEEILQYHARRFLYLSHKDAWAEHVRKEGKEPSEAAFELILSQTIQTLLLLENFRLDTDHDLDVTSTEAAAAIFFIEKSIPAIFRNNYIGQKKTLIESFSER